MIEAAKALPGLIKDWKTNRDLIYQHVGCVAGLLTIAAYVHEQRPSEVLADLFTVAGVPSAGDWLESNLPPFLAQPDAPVKSHPHTGGRCCRASHARDAVLQRTTERASCRFSGCRPVRCTSRSTTWILLVIAVQLGSLQWGIEWLRSTSLILGAIAAFGLVTLLVVYAVARKLEMQDLLAPVGRGLWWLIARGSACSHHGRLRLSLRCHRSSTRPRHVAVLHRVRCPL